MILNGGRISGVLMVVILAVVPMGGVAAGGCLPGKGQPVLGSEPDEPKVPANLSVWVDGSASMAGFAELTGQTDSEDYPYRELILELPRLLLALGVEMEFHAYGADKAGKLVERDLDRQAFAAASSRAFYSDDGLRHDADPAPILARAAQGPADRVTMVFTDLFLTDPGGGGGTDPDSLIAPLRQFLVEGRAVALVAVVSRFNGRIYDLPGATQKVDHWGWRPFFLVIAGGSEQVAWTLDMLTTRTVLFDIGRNPDEPPTYRVLRFGERPAMNWRRPELEVRSGDVAGKGMSRRTLVPGEDSGLQYVVRRSDAPVAEMDLGAGLSVQGGAARLPKVTPSLWVLHGEEDLRRHPCRRDGDAPAWKPVEGSGAVNALVAWDKDRLTLFPDWRRLGFLDPRSLYFLELEIEGQAEADAAGPQGWVDAWSIDVLEAAKGAYAKREPFPAVGLEGLVDALTFLDEELGGVSGVVLDRVGLVFRVE